MNTNKKRIIDLTKEQAKKEDDLITTIKDRLYSREGANSYHAGNVFAVKFNEYLNNV